MTSKSPSLDSLPPMPNSPNHPETPPPNIPIPGKPTPGDKGQSYKCKICGKVFNSKTEIEVHIRIEHGN